MLLDESQVWLRQRVQPNHGYYEKSGALRDMVPNHLAEMLSLVAMEPPVSFSALHMRDKQVELLATVRQIQPQDVHKYAVRGQYGPGFMDNSVVAGYREEKGADAKSGTETYVAMHLEIDNWRWSGIPFYLRTGKRLSKTVTEVVVTFRHPPARLFSGDHHSDEGCNRLIFNFKPEQNIHLTFNAKAPGLKTSIHPGSMEFQLPAGPFGNHAKGYERLLHDVMTGEPILFQRADFVEAGWRIVQPVIDCWQEAPGEDFPNYAAGSNGPEAADGLLSANGHAWHSLENE